MVLCFLKLLISLQGGKSVLSKRIDWSFNFFKAKSFIKYQLISELNFYKKILKWSSEMSQPVHQQQNEITPPSLEPPSDNKSSMRTPIYEKEKSN